MTAEHNLDVDSATSTIGTRLVSRASGVLATRTSRRGFLTRTAVVGSALAVAPVRYVLQPGTAYAAVCNCSGQSCNCGSSCCDGYTEFCCTLTGENTCPPGTAAGGWWKADAPGLCGSAPRYYLDCNVIPGYSPCQCGCGNGDCNNRKACCTQFRYGQCHREIPAMGPIMCRVVTCASPWEFDPTCTRQALTDNNTRFHDAPCLHDAEQGRGPAIAATPDGRLHVFARATDRAIWTSIFTPGTGWGGWSSLGGSLGSDPDAVVDSDGRVHVFAGGSDNALWWTSRGAGGSWSGWLPLGGGLKSGPGGCASPDGRLDVFIRGLDDALWHRRYSRQQGWLGWQALGGVLSSAPDPTRTANGDMHVFGRGFDDAVWGRFVNAQGWSDWYSLGGILTSGPSAVASEPGTLDVFAMGSNHSMWARTRQGQWSDWNPLGGTFVADPDAVAHGGQITVVGRGADSAIWGNTRTAGVWSGWYSIGAPG